MAVSESFCEAAQMSASLQVWAASGRVEESCSRPVPVRLHVQARLKAGISSITMTIAVLGYTRYHTLIYTAGVSSLSADELPHSDDFIVLGMRRRSRPSS